METIEKFISKTAQKLRLTVSFSHLKGLRGGVTLAAATGVLFALSVISVRGDEPRPEKGVGMDLCALQKDYSFFTDRKVDTPTRPAETLNCKDLLATQDALRISDGQPELAEPTAFEDELRSIVSGSPMEAMVPAIATFDREIAGLIIGIGKKESNWGIHTPKLTRGEECYNFWGYRGTGDRGFTPDGYGCFSTPETAVQAIGGRLEKLKELRSSSTPERMVVWKCGSSCATHSPESVRKWISDVNLYYKEIARK